LSSIVAASKGFRINEREALELPNGIGRVRLWDIDCPQPKRASPSPNDHRNGIREMIRKSYPTDNKRHSGFERNSLHLRVSVFKLPFPARRKSGVEAVTVKSTMLILKDIPASFLIPGSSSSPILDANELRTTKRHCRLPLLPPSGL
jgi:hypothetical protein